MPARHVAVKTADLQPGTDNDWVVSHNKRSRATIIVRGLRKDLSTLEVRSIFADLGLERFVRGKVYWESDHGLLLTSKDSKRISKELVRDVSSVLRGIGCRCVLDDSKRLDTSACSSELDKVH